MNKILYGYHNPKTAQKYGFLSCLTPYGEIVEVTSIIDDEMMAKSSWVGDVKELKYVGMLEKVLKNNYKQPYEIGVEV